MKILWISFIWPEPSSSAAGFRSLQLMTACKQAGYQLHIVSPCQMNKHQERLISDGFITHQFLPNQSAFDDYLAHFAPDVVFFDRFMMEEQFGWRVRTHAPQALRILDTIDLQSLRRARQRKCIDDVVSESLTDRELQSEDALREIASILRCDLSFIISDVELKFLTERYHIDPSLLSLCRFGYPVPDTSPPFASRKNMVMIGNFNHAPNIDGFTVLHEIVWPLIRDKLRAKNVNDVELHIVGAYPTSDFQQRDNAKAGFRVRGWVADAIHTLRQYRVNLAPLRFGAGIKGKVSDGWAAGVPCVATSIAAEGMHEMLPFGGMIEDRWDHFADSAVTLYLDATAWEQAQDHGITILSELYDQPKNTLRFLDDISRALKHREVNRAKNFLGAMLWHHQHRSTEFFSRWIEAKNQLVDTRQEDGLR